MYRKKHIIKKLKDFEMRVNRDYPVTRIIFFGSRAENKGKRHSDIDLIIVSKKFKKLNFIKRAAKMYDYWDLKYPVDFLCYTPQEFNRKKNGITIVREAVENGIAI